MKPAQNNNQTSTIIPDYTPSDEEVLLKNAILEAQYETSLDGILVVGADSKTISYNANFAKMWSIPKKVLDTKDDNKMLDAVMSRLKDPEKFVSKVKYLYDHPDEKSVDEVHLNDGRVFDRYSSPLIDANKKYQGRVWYFRDNTERKNLEVKLAREEEEQEIILDSIPAWVFYKDKDNCFIRVNKAFANVMGVAKSNLEHKSLIDIFPKEQAENFSKDDKEVMDSGKPKINIIESMKSPNGTLWVQTDKIPYRDSDGNTVGIIGFSIDISERKKAEDALKSSKDYLENILNYIGDPVFVKDNNSKFIIANNALCEMLGIDRANIIGKTLGESLPKDQMDKFLENDRMVLKSGQENISEEPLTGKGGKVLTIVTKKTRYVDENGNKFLIGVIRDISERKLAENKIKEKADELEKSNKIMMGRELKMIELKNEIERLKKQVEGGI